MLSLARQCFDCLRRMDAEADTMCNGEPTGLNYYGAHARPELKRPQTEPEWSKRLAALLCENGQRARAEMSYPTLPLGKHNRCDVVVSMPNGDTIWLELKGAWKHYWMTGGGNWIYQSYLFHPLVKGLDPKSHTAALDIEKLKSITIGSGTHVGLLLVGFDSTKHNMDADIERLAQLAGLPHAPTKLPDEGGPSAAAPWQHCSAGWEDVRRAGERVKVWAWLRPVS